MSEPSSSNPRKAPRVVLFKRHAHLFTWISILWTIISIAAITFFDDSKYPDSRFLIAIGIWLLHAVCIGLSIYFWKTERDSVLMVQPDVDEKTSDAP